MKSKCITQPQLKMAELIKWDLAKAGVDVKVRSVTRTYLIEQLRKGTEDYDLILTGWRCWKP